MEGLIYLTSEDMGILMTGVNAVYNEAISVLFL